MEKDYESIKSKLKKLLALAEGGVGGEAQKDYFRTRLHDTLCKSKALEAEIYREIKRVRALGYPAEQPQQQPSLFSPTT